jgi:hypothetical protein
VQAGGTVGVAEGRVSTEEFLSPYLHKIAAAI